MRHPMPNGRCPSTQVCDTVCDYVALCLDGSQPMTQSVATSMPVSPQRLATRLPGDVIARDESSVLHHGRATAQSLKGLNTVLAFPDLAVNVATA